MAEKTKILIDQPQVYLVRHATLGGIKITRNFVQHYRVPSENDENVLEQLRMFLNVFRLHNVSLNSTNLQMSV